MERLKTILRQALQLQAQRVKLAVGKPTEALTAQGPLALSDAGTPDEAYLQKLAAFLFPNDQAALGAGQPVKGLLNVPSVGRLLLIAQATPPASLRIYLPPQGTALFESDWSRLSGPSAAAVQAVPPPPSGAKPVRGITAPPFALDPGGSLWGGPAAGATSGHGMPAAGATSGHGLPAAGLTPGLAARAPDPSGRAGVAGAGSPPTDQSYGFTPTGLAPPEVVHPASHAMPLAVAKGTAVSPAMTAQPQAFDAAPQHTHFVPTVAAPPSSSFPSPWDGVQPGAVTPAGPSSDEGTGTINFGPDGTGEADVSDGQNLIDAVLIDMIKRKASDLHMTCGEPLCFRIDGAIHRISAEATTPEQVEAYLSPIIPPRNRAEFAKLNDTDFAYEIREVGRFRVNVFRDKNGVGSVMRHIPSKILTAEQLSLPPAITKFCQLSKGLVLVTGPTGSGKSTTLAAMIDLINKTRADHILTVEDPIEFVHPQQHCLINQREVYKHTGSFARALKAALREDPDIVLIGEMRDLETVGIAIETAETGHLVFGTLHTNTAVSTIDRIIDQFPTDEQEQIRMMLSSSLKGVVAQTLLKKKGGGGRVAAHEILVTNDAVSAMIREGKNHMIPNHMQSQKADGNILLNESLLKLVKDGIVDAEDALRKAVDKASLIEMYKRGGVKVEGAAPAAAAARPVGKQSA